MLISNVSENIPSPLKVRFLAVPVNTNYMSLQYFDVTESPLLLYNCLDLEPKERTLTLGHNFPLQVKTFGEFISIDLGLCDYLYIKYPLFDLITERTH